MAGVREQDQYMPIANVIRIMRKILPPHAKISDEAKETIQECVSEYISFVTAEANDRCQREQRKTVTAEDIVWAMGKLGFDDYVQPLTFFLERYRESEGEPASVRRASASAYAASACPLGMGMGMEMGMGMGMSMGMGMGMYPLPPPPPPPQPQPQPPPHPQPQPQPQQFPAFAHSPPPPYPQPHQPEPYTHNQGFGMFDFDPTLAYDMASGSGSGSGPLTPGFDITNFDPFGDRHDSL